MSIGAEVTPTGFVSLPEFEEVLVREDALAGLAQIEGIIFDLDGIVIDPSGSIFSAHPVAMQFWAERFRGLTNCADLVSETDLAHFRLAGGFNDDWNIASATALVYSVKAVASGSSDGQYLRSIEPTLEQAARNSASFGGGVDGVKAWLLSEFGEQTMSQAEKLWDGDLVKQLFMEVIAGPYCQEMYGFTAEHYIGEPRILNDRLVVDREALEVPFQVSVYTGRTYGEARVGLRLTGLEGWAAEDRIITVTEGWPKPNGEPVRILAERMGGRPAAYIGDNIDDLNSVMLYRKLTGPPVYSVQVCYADFGGQARQRFIKSGADIIAPDSGSALRALVSLRKGQQLADRTAQLDRETKETQIKLEINLDGSGKSSVQTGLGFFDHMLDQLCRHGLFDITIDAKGDLHIDDHHLVEDTGIALGTAFAKALGDKAGITRFGWSAVPLDEALVLVSVDLSGRGLLTAELGPMDERVGQFTTALLPEFLRAFASCAGITLHVRTLAGGNTHHVIEASFKALAVALRAAVSPDSRRVGIPSTKGTL